MRETEAQHEYVEAGEEMCSLKEVRKSPSSLLGIPMHLEPGNAVGT
jgi:hypothetical protein